MRNPEYQFIDTDTSALVAEMISDYEKITGVGARPASPERLFIAWVASVVVRQRVLSNYIGNQNLPSRATGDNLDALGQLFFKQTRPQAQPAVCTVRFHISEKQDTSILIPAGTRVTDIGNTLEWATTTDVFISIGEVYTDVPVRCQTNGVLGNGYASGQINTLIDISNIAYYDRCENTTISDGGADAATDDEFYALMRASEDAYSSAGAKGAYIYFAKRVSTEIADVVANSPSAGQVSLYVLMKDGTPAGEELKDAVLKACNEDTVRPLTDYVVMGDPDVATYDIELTYYIPNNAPRGSAEVEEAVQAAVEGYVTWQRGKLGRDINPDELRQRVKDTGVKRIDLTSPAFTVLRDGSDDTPPQYAAVGSITVINGGYENE